MARLVMVSAPSPSGCGVSEAAGIDVAVAGGGVDGQAGGAVGGLQRVVGADLGGTGQTADGDVAGVGGQADVGGLVELDRVLGAVGAVEGDVAQPSDAPEFGGGGLGLDAGAGRQLDGHLDGSGAAEDPALRRRAVDPQDAVGVVDRRLL